MGGEQAARTMSIVTEAAAKRRGKAIPPAVIAAPEQRNIERFDRQLSVFVASAHVLDDGVIDPRDTRAVLAQVLTVCREAEARKPASRTPCNFRWHGHDDDAF